MTPADDLISLTQFTKLSQLHTFSRFFWKRNFLKRRGTEVSSRDVHLTFCVHAEHFSLNQPSLVVGWPFYNFKSPKTKRSASPFGRKTRRLQAILKNSALPITMAGPRACRSPCRNCPLTGEDKLARVAPRAAFTHDSDIPFYIPAVSCVPTPAPAPSVALAKLMAKYTNADLQRAIQLALELFLRRLVTLQWLQYKRGQNEVAPMTWQKFKNFLQKNFSNSRAFVDSIWSKIKRDSQY